MIYGRKWMVRYAEQYGLPFRLGKHDPNATEEEKALIISRLEDMGSSGIGLIPKDTELELVESAKNSSENPQNLLLQLADQLCDITILGQTLTTDVGDSGSLALGQVHENVRKDRLIEVAEWSADMISYQLIPSIIELNWGDREEVPYVRFEIEESKDSLAAAQRDQILHTMGVKLSIDELREKHSLTVPRNEEDTLPPAVSSIQAFASNGAIDPRIAVSAASKTDLLSDEDKLLNAVIEDVTGVADQYTKPLQPVFAKLLSQIQDGKLSDEDLIKALESAEMALPGMLDEFDHVSLSQSIENTMSSASINGAFDRMRQTLGKDD